ncbi:hypothetical protein ACQP08_20645 [Micromonospora zamorensis]|uniref:hypothetical protein n=1 Tax=Micromonospora zamorensis TaxID=709883 RepID=UPI003D90E289
MAFLRRVPLIGPRSATTSRSSAKHQVRARLKIFFDLPGETIGTGSSWSRFTASAGRGRVRTPDASADWSNYRYLDYFFMALNGRQFSRRAARISGLLLSGRLGVINFYYLAGPARSLRRSSVIFMHRMEQGVGAEI